ncbi:hypothetical protein Cco03nite_72680 [Catellatospora coxensis]|uniref:Uncharacterized protein n=2 Tax=Catellatospora coxensis TaxID=310354 RepID=A0A8J3KXM2_9ACTN|nr:hypothetical protein Cco03nite_72680 [Catellatospora coxensis]
MGSIPGQMFVGALTEFSAEQLADQILTGRAMQSDHPWAAATAGAVDGLVEGGVDKLGGWIRGRRNGVSAGLDGDVGNIDIPSWAPKTGGAGGDGDAGGGGPRFFGVGLWRGDFEFDGRFGAGGVFEGLVRFTGLGLRGDGSAVSGSFSGSGTLVGTFVGGFAKADLRVDERGVVVGHVRGSGELDALFNLSGTFTPLGKGVAPAVPGAPVSVDAGGVRGGAVTSSANASPAHGGGAGRAGANAGASVTPQARVLTGPEVNDADTVARPMPVGVPGAVPAPDQVAVVTTATSPSDHVAVVTAVTSPLESMAGDPRSGPEPGGEPVDALPGDDGPDGTWPDRMAGVADTLTGPTEHTSAFDDRSDLDDRSDSTMPVTPALTIGSSAPSTTSLPLPPDIQPPGGRPQPADAKPILAALLGEGAKPDADAKVRSWMHDIEPGRFSTEVYTVLTETPGAVPGPSTHTATAAAIADGSRHGPAASGAPATGARPAHAERSDALRRSAVMRAAAAAMAVATAPHADQPQVVRFRRILTDPASATVEDLAYLASVYGLTRRIDSGESLPEPVRSSLERLGLPEGNQLDAALLWLADELVHGRVPLGGDARFTEALTVAQRAIEDRADPLGALREAGLLPAEGDGFFTVPDETASPPAVLTILLQERAQLMVAAADAVGQVWQWWFEPRHQEMLHSIDGMRRSLALAPVGTTGQEPGGKDGQTPVGPRETLDLILRTTRDRLLEASPAQLDELKQGVERLAHGFFVWRHVLNDQAGRTGDLAKLFPTPPDRPAAYQALAGRVQRLHELLTRLPTDERDARTERTSPLGIKWTRDGARRQLVHAAGRAEAALFAADSAMPPMPWVEPTADRGREVEEATQALEQLVSQLEQVVEARPVPVTELPPPPDGWEPQERFAPPVWLVPDDGGRSTLGATDLPRDFSEEMITEVRRAILEAFAHVENPELVRSAVDDMVHRQALLNDAYDLINDEWTFRILGYDVAVSLFLNPREGTWRQASDAAEIRGKETTSQSGRHGHSRGHMQFFDSNSNLTWYLQHAKALVEKGFTWNEAFAGLATIVWHEHEESSTLNAAHSSERTIKGSSYVSYLFAFDPVVAVKVTGKKKDEYTNSLMNVVRDGVKIFVSRETARPLDDAARSVSGAVHPGEDAPSKVGDRARVRLPRDSAAQAFTKTAQLRRIVEHHVADLAPPGGARHRRLLAGLKHRRVVAGVYAAEARGYEIIFGDIDGQAPESVTIHFAPANPRLVIESDDKTWMDIDDQTMVHYGSEQLAADGFDLPPGLFLQAFGFVLLPVVGQKLPSVGKLEPYFFLWPTLDAVRVRSGPSLDVSDLSGVRFTGERTAVAKLDVYVMLGRSDRPGLSRPEVLSNALYQRVLREDAKEWAILPALPGDVDSTKFTLHVPDIKSLTPVTRISDLTFDPLTEAGPAALGPRPQPLVDAALELIRAYYPGVVTNPDGSATHYAHGFWSHVDDARMAVENTRRVRDELNEDSAASLIRRAQGETGYSFTLSRKGVTGRWGDTIVVRVRAQRGRLHDGRVVFEHPVYKRHQPFSEMDANKTSNRDLITTAIRDFGVWAGAQPMLALSHVHTRHLKSLQLRPILQFKYGSAPQASSGLATWAMHGISLDDEAQFRGPVVFTLQIEGLGRQAMPTGVPRLDDLEQGIPLAEPAERAPFPPALPSVHHAAPVTGTYTMLMPSDMTTREVVADGASTSRPYSLDVPAIRDAGVTSLNGPDGRPRHYRPTQARPLPPEAPLFLNSDTLVRDVLQALADLGHRRIPADTRVVLERVLAGGLDEWLPTLSRGEPDDNPVYREIFDGAITEAEGASRRHVVATIGMRLVFEEDDGFTLIGLPISYGGYSDMGVEAVTAHGGQTTLGLWGGFRPRFPIKIEKDIPGVHVDHYSYQPQLAQRREKSATVEAESSGSTGLSQLNITRLALTRIKVCVEVSIATRVEQNVVGKAAGTVLPAGGVMQRAVRGVLGRIGSWGDSIADLILPGSAAGGFRTVSSPAEGVTAFDALDATELGLMPPELELHYDRTIEYVLPPTLRHGLGAGRVVRPPDLSRFVSQVVASVEQSYGRHVAHAVRQEIYKLGGRSAGGALLNSLLGSGVPITVPVASYLRAWRVPVLPAARTIKIEVYASPARAEYKGVAASLHRLGIREAGASALRQGDIRDRRLIFDYGRGWFATMPKTINSFLLNLHGDLRGITKRAMTHATQQERSRGLVVETGRSGEALRQWALDNGVPLDSQHDIGTAGAATFDVVLDLHAEVRVETAPTAVVDAVTQGALQTGRRWRVGRDGTDIDGRPIAAHADFEVTTRLKYDPRELQPMVSGLTTLPPAPAPDSTPRQVPGIWELQDGQDLNDMRAGLDMRGGLLAEASGGLITDLRLIKDDVTYLAVPRPVTVSPGELGGVAGMIEYVAQSVAATWDNNFWNAPPGSSWFHPKGLIEDQISVIVSEAFLSGRITDLLTTGIKQTIQYPVERFYFARLAYLELLADPISVVEKPTVDDVMSKDMTASAFTAGHSTTSSAGFASMPWAAPDFALPEYENYDGPGSASAGVLQGFDLIGRHDDGAANRQKNSAGGGSKTTGGSYTTLVFTVRWLVAIRPQNPGGGAVNPYSGRPSLYTHLPESTIELSVPNHLKHLVLQAPQRNLSAPTPVVVANSRLRIPPPEPTDDGAVAPQPRDTDSVVPATLTGPLDPQPVATVVSYGPTAVFRRLMRFVGSDASGWAVTPASGLYRIADRRLHERHPWLLRANPGHSRGGEFITNCVLAAIAGDMTLREWGQPDFGGYQVPPSKQAPVLDLVRYAKDVFADSPGFIEVSGGWPAVRDAVAKAPGSLGIVGFGRAPARGGSAGHQPPGWHVVNVFHEEDTAVFVDVQAGDAAVLPDAHAPVFFLPLTPLQLARGYAELGTVLPERVLASLLAGVRQRQGAHADRPPAGQPSVLTRSRFSRLFTGRAGDNRTGSAAAGSAQPAPGPSQLPSPAAVPPRSAASGVDPSTGPAVPLHPVAATVVFDLREGAVEDRQHRAAADLFADELAREVYSAARRAEADRRLIVVIGRSVGLAGTAEADQVVADLVRAVEARLLTYGLPPDEVRYIEEEDGTLASGRVRAHAGFRPVIRDVGGGGIPYRRLELASLEIPGDAALSYVESAIRADKRFAFDYQSEVPVSGHRRVSSFDFRSEESDGGSRRAGSGDDRSVPEWVAAGPPMRSESNGVTAVLARLHEYASGFAGGAAAKSERVWLPDLLAAFAAAPAGARGIVVLRGTGRGVGAVLNVLPDRDGPRLVDPRRNALVEPVDVQVPALFVSTGEPVVVVRPYQPAAARLERYLARWNEVSRLSLLQRRSNELRAVDVAVRAYREVVSSREPDGLLVDNATETRLADLRDAIGAWTNSKIVERTDFGFSEWDNDSEPSEWDQPASKRANAVQDLGVAVDSAYAELLRERRPSQARPLPVESYYRRSAEVALAENDLADIRAVSDPMVQVIDPSTGEAVEGDEPVPLLANAVTAAYRGFSARRGRAGEVLGVLTLPEGTFMRDGRSYTEADRELFIDELLDMSMRHPHLLIMPGAMVWTGTGPSGQVVLNITATAFLNGRVVHELHLPVLTPTSHVDRIRSSVFSVGKHQFKLAVSPTLVRYAVNFYAAAVSGYGPGERLAEFAHPRAEARPLPRWRFQESGHTAPRDEVLRPHDDMSAPSLRGDARAPSDDRSWRTPSITFGASSHERAGSRGAASGSEGGRSRRTGSHSFIDPIAEEEESDGEVSAPDEWERSWRTPDIVVIPPDSPDES